MKRLVERRVLEAERVRAEGIIKTVCIGRIVCPVLVHDLRLEVLAVHEEADTAALPLERVLVKAGVCIG